MDNKLISREERIERLNAVRHEIAQHFNEGFAWIDQILSEEIEQIDLEERRTGGINATTIDDGNWNGYAIPHDEGREFVADSVSKKEALLAFIDKGQNSKRYNWGDTWELNASEIREVLDSLPTIQVQIIEVILKLQTYKLFEEDSELYVSREDVLNLFK